MAMTPQARGGLAFLNTNRAATSFDTTNKNLQATRKQEQADAVDAATREALLQAYGRQRQPAAPQTPAGEPSAPAPTGEATAAGQATPAAPATQATAPQAQSSGDGALFNRASPPAESSNPYGSAVARLAATPGAGAAALKLAQQGERMSAIQRREAMANEQRMLVALGKGDTAAAQHWATRAGTTIPPEIANNREQAALFGRGSLLARGLYPNKEQALAFTAAFVRSGGDVTAAQAATGTPRPAVRAQGAGGGGGGGGAPGRMSPTTYVDENGETVRGYWDPRNPGAGIRPLTVGPAGAGGGNAPRPPAGDPGLAPAPRDGSVPLATDVPVLAPPGAMPGTAGTGGAARVPQRTPGQGSQPRPAAAETRRKLLEAGGYSPEDAARIAGGGMPSANAIVTARTRIMGQVQGSTDAIGKDVAWVTNRTDELMDGTFPGWRTMLQPRLRPPENAGGGGGGLAAVQAPGATTSTPSATAGSAQRPAPTADAPLTSVPSGTAGGNAPAPSGAPARDPATVLQQARQAVQRGANRQQVIDRLRQMGIDPAGL